MYQSQCGDGFISGFTSVHVPVSPDNLLDLPADLDYRVERTHRVLENHRNPCPAKPAHRFAWQREHVDVIEPNVGCLAHPHHTGVVEAHNRQRSYRFSRARLAHYTYSGTVGHLERNVDDGVVEVASSVEADVEVLDPKE